MATLQSSLPLQTSFAELVWSFLRERLYRQFNLTRVSVRLFLDQSSPFLARSFQLIEGQKSKPNSSSGPDRVTLGGHRYDLNKR